MNDKFDELAKGLAQSATRRQALKKFGVGVAGIVLASLGAPDKTQASQCKPSGSPCTRDSECCSGVCFISEPSKRKRGNCI